MLQPLSFRSLAKSDLHAHFVLSAPRTVYESILGRTIPVPERFTGLHHFLSFIAEHYVPALSSPENLAHILEEALKQMIRDGVVVTELSFHHSIARFAGTTWSALIPRFQSIIDTVASKLRVLPEFGIPREAVFSEWEKDMHEALPSGFFSSIDLYGDELAAEIEAFDTYFDFARSFGLKIKIHTGEIGGPERVLRELEHVRPDAVQHGVRAAEKSEVLAVLADSGVQVNVCPTSNLMLSVVSQFREHPIRQMYDSGVRVTINSDDFGVFGSSVSDEYMKLIQAGIFSEDELKKICKNGF